MWKTFKKSNFTIQKPAVSVTSRGLEVNKAAVLLLDDDLPDKDLDFVVLIDRASSQIGLRLMSADDGNVDVFPGRRPRTGRMMPAGTRKFTNTWRIHGAGFAAAAGLEIGRYEAFYKGKTGQFPAMIVIFPGVTAGNSRPAEVLG